jgi:REP element-mobilizing transposase RayT
MSRRLRLHVAGGTYYVTQAVANGDAIFRHPEDRRAFERLLGAALRRTRSTLLAYCWRPDSIHCAIRIEEVPVGRLMQAATSRFAREMRRARGEQGHFFRHRYRALLLDAESYLLPLVRYIHELADEGDPSSDAAYRCKSAGPKWLDTRPVRRMLACSGTSYERFFADPPSPEERALFERGGDVDRRVIGDATFLASLPRSARAYRTTTTLEQIIETVTCRLGVDGNEVLSGSRRREVALARALIAWYAGERHVASLAEVARRLRRDPSTLSVGISRYRRCRRELFDVASLHDLAPLVRVNDAAHP